MWGENEFYGLHQSYKKLNFGPLTFPRVINPNVVFRNPKVTGTCTPFDYYLQYSININMHAMQGYKLQWDINI